MNCLIVDDDECMRIDLEKKIGKISFLNYLGSCASATEATRFLASHSVDLLVLDVMLPGTNGLQFLESFTAQRPQVILISSDRNYAVEAFDRAVVDFLVKPVSEERFIKAVLRASQSRMGMLNSKSSHKKDHLFVKTKGAYLRVPISTIHYIEAQSDHLNIVTDGGALRVHATLKTMSDNIPIDQFFRIHNSFIVNLQKISGLEGNSVRINTKVIPVSRSRQKELMSRINLV